MSKRLLFIIIFFALSLGCGDASTKSNLQQEVAAEHQVLNRYDSTGDASQDLFEMATRLGNCFADVSKSEAFEVAYSFVDLQEGRASDWDWASKIFGKLRDQLDLSTISDQNIFLFGIHAGEYSWDFVDAYSKQPLRDRIRINMPKNSSANSNGITMEIKRYVDQELLIEDVRYHLPTIIEASGQLMGQELATIQFLSDYSNDVWSFPNSASFEVKVNNYEIQIKFNREDSVNATATLQVKGGRCNITFASSVELHSNDYPSLKYDDIDLLTFELLVDNMSINGDVEFDELVMGSDGEISVTEFRNNIKSNLSISGLKVAELGFNNDKEPIVVDSNMRTFKLVHGYNSVFSKYKADMAFYWGNRWFNSNRDWDFRWFEKIKRFFLRFFDF